MDGAAGAQALRTPFASGITMQKPFFSMGATDPHAASVAFPVFGAGDELVGALVLSGPSSRLTPGCAEAINDVFLDATRDLMRSLGCKAA